MNRTILVILTLVVVGGSFAAAAWLISDSRTAMTGTPPGPASTLAADGLVQQHSPTLGRADAPVTIVEFFDPACEACRAFHPVVKRILAENPETVRVVMRYTPFHGEGSEIAIAALEAAREQDLFEPVLEALLDRQREWASHDAPASSRILEIAAEAGLDREQAQLVMRSPETIGIINRDRADVETFKIRGTPTFFVNGARLTQFSPEGLNRAVERAISKASGS